MAYCDVGDVKKKLRIADLGVNYQDSDIEELIDSAERKIKSYLANIFSNETITSWKIESNNVPDEVKDLTADLTAAFVYNSFYGHSLSDEKTLGGDLYQRTLSELKAIATRKKEIITKTDEERISPVKSDVHNTTSGQDALYTMRDDDGDAGGTLKNY